MSEVTPKLDSKGDVLSSRFLALIVDGVVGLVAFVVSLGVAILATSQLPSTVGWIVGPIALVAGLFGPFVYRVYAEGEHGQTLWKRVAGLVVVTPEGEPIGYSGSVVRNLLRIVDNLPVFYLIGVVCTSVTDGKRLGDLAAGTVVVATE